MFKNQFQSLNFKLGINFSLKKIIKTEFLVGGLICVSSLGPKILQVNMAFIYKD